MRLGRKRASQVNSLLNACEPLPHPLQRHITHCAPSRREHPGHLLLARFISVEPHNTGHLETHYGTAPFEAKQPRYQITGMRYVQGQAVPQQPPAVGQPDAPPPPVMRNPPDVPRWVFPKDFGQFAGRNPHLDRGCAPPAVRHGHVLDICVPEVPPCRRAPEFVPPRLVRYFLAAGLDDGRDAFREPVPWQSPRAAACVRAECP